MLTREQNELLCQVSGGAPMGELLREFWMPAVRSQALVADGAPVRVRLMGENFVAFRATDGRVGFFDEGCPHRCTSLALARNEDNALTCIFHGWKIDVSGKVVEVPSEPPERRSEFAAKVRVRHYPVHEAGGALWVYLGRRQAPQFYNFEFNLLPRTQVRAVRALVHCNWLQGLEGLLDSAHFGILHQSFVSQRATDDRFSTHDQGPVFKLMAQPYGLREGALRKVEADVNYLRIREVVMPFYSFIPFDRPPWQMICVIPIDDEWSAQWVFRYDHSKPISDDDQERWLRLRGTEDSDNFCAEMADWHAPGFQNRQAMKEGHWSGLPKFFYEDFAAQVSMGPMADRTREYLGSSDSIITHARQMLMRALRDHARGEPAFGQDRALDYSRLRAVSIRYRGELDWRAIDPLKPPPPVEG